MLGFFALAVLRVDDDDEDMPSPPSPPLVIGERPNVPIIGGDEDDAETSFSKSGTIPLYKMSMLL